ncbi:hypothetical protein J6590_006095 [Homalodisca vitripennis]|nr:hypothetical protein J6590_006095 [Homalodisca vitripennis]
MLKDPHRSQKGSDSSPAESTKLPLQENNIVITSINVVEEPNQSWVTICRLVTVVEQGRKREARCHKLAYHFKYVNRLSQNLSPPLNLCAVENLANLL